MSCDFPECRPIAGGSNSGLGPLFQPFGINNLELVAQTSASWNPLTSWLETVDALRRAA